MRRFLCIIASLLLASSLSAAKKVTWVIDPGHGGRDTGCESRRHNEKEITLDVAKELGRLIKKNISGVRVVYTRERDKYLSLQERCDIANARGAELFLSIHVNSAPNPYARGTESFYATNVPLKGTQAGKSELLALLLQRQYLAHGREVSRGVKKRELYVCEHTNMPSVLTEIGFITNNVEEAYITSKDGKHELAKAICEALAEYRELTKSGTVDKQKLRNLRYSHYAPLSIVNVNVKPQDVESEADRAEELAEVAKDNRAKAEAEAKAKAEAEAEAKARAEAEAKEKAEAKAEAEAKAKAEAEAKAKAEAEAKGKAEAEAKSKAEIDAKSKAEAEAKSKAEAQAKAEAKEEDRPYFAIQLMNTATKLKEGDYRLKGFKGVRYIAAGDRFKVIYSHATDYQVIKNELVQVRETFPEAFIVAFIGDQQITTAEALKRLKP